MVDLKEWDRGNLFHFYIVKTRIVMSLTVDNDTTLAGDVVLADDTLVASLLILCLND